jgi:hypothetical protein
MFFRLKHQLWRITKFNQDFFVLVPGPDDGEPHE